MEREGVATVKGNAVTLVGPELKTGEKAPDFTVVNKELKAVTLSDFEGKVKIISVTPSLDTPVCDAQIRRFNEEAAKMEGAAIINISMDLPFAISRFCTTAGIESVETLSDHRDASFASAYGVLIKELRLHARSIFVLDADNTLVYQEVVGELTDHPDYDKALEAAHSLLNRKTQAAA